MNRIEQLINDMQQYIDSCKVQAFSGNRKIVVERGAIEDFFAELRTCMPEVIERSEKIVNNKEAIINDARTQAEKLLSDASVKTNELVDEHEIVQQAIERGNEILEDATRQAQEILNQAFLESNAFKESALQYTTGAMEALRALHEETLTSTKDLFEQHLETISSRYQAISESYDNYISSIGSAGQAVSGTTEATESDEDAYGYEEE